MPIHLEVDHDKRFAIVRMSGGVFLQDILLYFDALVAEGAMSYAKLVDAQEAEPMFGDDDMTVVADRVRMLAAFDPRGPIAAVASTPEMLKFLQRFKQLDGARRPIETFATIEGARAWLASRSQS